MSKIKFTTENFIFFCGLSNGRKIHKFFCFFFHPIEYQKHFFLTKISQISSTTYINYPYAAQTGLNAGVCVPQTWCFSKRSRKRSMIICCLIIWIATKVNSWKKLWLITQMYTAPARCTQTDGYYERFFFVVALFVVCHTFIQFYCINTIEWWFPMKNKEAYTPSKKDIAKWLMYVVDIKQT